MLYWLQLITIDYILLRNEIVLDFYKDLPVRRKETWSASTKSESGDFWCWKRRRGHEIETNGSNWLTEFSDLQLLTSAVYLNSFQLILQLFFSLGFNLWFNWTNISAALTFETFLTGRMKGWKDMFFKSTDDSISEMVFYFRKGWTLGLKRCGQLFVKLSACWVPPHIWSHWNGSAGLWVLSRTLGALPMQSHRWHSAFVDFHCSHLYSFVSFHILYCAWFVPVS